MLSSRTKYVSSAAIYERPSSRTLPALSFSKRGPRRITLASITAGAVPGQGLRVGAVGLALSPIAGGSVLPELDVAVLAEGPPLDETALLAHEVLNGQALVAKDIQVVADDVSVAARGAGDEYRAVMVALLGDVVGGARAAGDAGEGQLVGWLLWGVCGRFGGSWARNGVGEACC